MGHIEYRDRSDMSEEELSTGGDRVHYHGAASITVDPSGFAHFFLYPHNDEEWKLALELLSQVRRNTDHYTSGEGTNTTVVIGPCMSLTLTHLPHHPQPEGTKND